MRNRTLPCKWHLARLILTPASIRSSHPFLMGSRKPFALYSALLLFFLINLTRISVHGQLLQVTNDGGSNSGQPRTYIVHVANPKEAELLSDEDLESWYKSFLPNASLDSGAPRLVYSYRHAISGFAARLTPGEVKAMEGMDGFLYAQPDKLYHLETTYTHEFLGLSQPFGGSWDGTMYGEGVIIGVTDTGIFPTHDSFSDSMMPPPPTKWKAKCQYFRCNNKIIGARGFQGGLSPSPIDDSGHGTHVASTAAGNFVDNAQVLGSAKGRAAGMAPKAHLSIYKTCFKDGCHGADTLAAIDQAITDGVDVISMSIGGSSSDKLYEDAIAKGSLAAFKKGISICTSAGNAGPWENTLSHSAPWLLTVGASSTDRRIDVTIELGNGVEVHGESAFQPFSFNSSAFLPLVFPGRYGDPEALYCKNGSLDHIDVRGKIVVCSSGLTENIEKGEIVFAAGGSAMIIMNLPREGFTTIAYAHVLPAAQVNYMDGQKIKDYVLFAPSPTAAVNLTHTKFGFRPSPAVASFSSRGPSDMNGDILKPDVLAPGVNILGAWPSGVGPKPNPFITDTFNFESGTSMATPHVSGIIALLKHKYSSWSPAAIQSAIITSAKGLDLDGNPIIDEVNNKTANIYTTGAGQVNPAGALDPGLIYHLTHDNYISYLCSLGYNDTEVYWTVGQQIKCSKRKVMGLSRLNYPSIAVSLSSSHPTQTFERTATNVGEPNEVYRARIQEPPGVTVDLSTYELRFSRLQQDKSFNVTLTMARSPGKGRVAGGKLEWVSNKHVVKSPIAVRFA